MLFSKKTSILFKLSLAVWQSQMFNLPLKTCLLLFIQPDQQKTIHQRFCNLRIKSNPILEGSSTLTCSLQLNIIYAQVSNLPLEWKTPGKTLIRGCCLFFHYCTERKKKELAAPDLCSSLHFFHCWHSGGAIS